ncbi:SRF-like protein [Athelia psychrophila]|uniref:SRF-like protein n=1 Tax=Athelia psychrophila TaxID=1759441 RepID=A0A166PKW6_9AGAM|nr:SRF-like protein [Fibularhizoctonia sp. CBS 109695]
MGRRKIEIQPITHERNRSRKNGLFKKAYELGVLCSVDVAVIIFEERPGHNVKLYQYSSKNVDEIVQRHAKFDGDQDARGPADFSGGGVGGAGGKVESDAVEMDEDEGEAEEEEEEDAPPPPPKGKGKAKVTAKTEPVKEDVRYICSRLFSLAKYRGSLSLRAISSIVFLQTASSYSPVIISQPLIQGATDPELHRLPELPSFVFCGAGIRASPSSLIACELYLRIPYHPPPIPIHILSLNLVLIPAPYSILIAMYLNLPRTA